MNPVRWPLHPHPIQEESLLSWLARIAACYGLSTKEILKHDLGFHSTVEDLNKSVPPDLSTLLSQRTGLPEEKIYTMTLSAWSPLLLDDFTLSERNFDTYVRQFFIFFPSISTKRYRPKSLWRPWFSPVSVKYQACPRCIERQPRGVMALVWGLPLMLSCPQHACWLRRCYSYQGQFVDWRDESEAISDAPLDVQRMDQRTWSALTIGQVELPQRNVHGGVWLRLLRTLLDELHIPVSINSSCYAEPIIDIWTSLDLLPRGAESSWKPYEFLPESVQKATLRAAARAMDRIESELIAPEGKHTAFFLKKPTPHRTFPSFQKKPPILPAKAEPVCAWKELNDYADECLKKAKTDRQMAKNLRDLAILGRTAPLLIKEVDQLLLDCGVPVEFLVPD
ncbi:MAG: TniQ family protein [Gammaproteobacteria bacterium]|nr:TniQ family protein [Gammaproteobacteria bacterium]